MYIKTKTVYEIYKLWLDEYKRPFVKLSTLRRYESIYSSRIHEKIGCMPVNDIKPIHIQRIYNDMTREHLSALYVRSVHIVIRGILQTAYINNMITDNPCDRVTLPKVKKNGKHVLSVNEQKRLYEYTKYHNSVYANITILMLETGIRISEALALTPGDINIRYLKLSINKSLIYTRQASNNKSGFMLQPPKTDSSIRMIPLTGRAADVLIKQFEQMSVEDYHPKKNDLIFVNSRQHPLQRRDLAFYLDEVSDRIHVKHITPHILRHTFATRCFEAGISPKVVQSLLGHSSLDMTMNLYTHVTERKKKSDISLLESYMEYQ